MKCKNCGEELREQAAFCPKCGSAVERVSKIADTGAKKNKKALGLGLGIGVVVLLTPALVFVLGRRNVEQPRTDLGQDETVEQLKTLAEAEPLYNLTDIDSIDIYAQNYVPNAKSEGMKWDSSFFYWLEDIDQTSDEDGYLAKCTISKTLLKNAQTGEIIQYEIYRDPQSTAIYKIVSIENSGEKLKLTDYYYKDGKPNFIFEREDSVYTPTYATPDKVGSRFYFNDDVLVRWRMIVVPREIGEYVLTLTNASYSQACYFTESEEIQEIYDGIELKMLNAAYNTYNAVSASSVGTIEGSVEDTTGTPLANLVVDILRKSDNVLLYRGSTDADGKFSILTYLDDTECYIVIYGNEDYRPAEMYDVLLAQSGISHSYNRLVLHKVSGDSYPVHIGVYSAAEVRTGEDGVMERALLPKATVSIRSGSGARRGNVLTSGQADVEGIVQVNLQPGTYTAQVDVNGYATSYMEIEVPEQEVSVDSYVLQSVQENETGVVLTWDDADIDLDLTLFTPYQSTAGDMAHIGGNIVEDEHGNRLLADNKSGCEVMYVNTAELGSYKLYVNNYTDSNGGNYLSEALSKLNIHIYIYDSNGLVAEYTFPADQVGVVWEVADINGGKVTPIHRVYSSVAGKEWWTAEKGIEAKNKQALQAYQEFLNGERAVYIDEGVASENEWGDFYGEAGKAYYLRDLVDVYRDCFFDGVEMDYAFLDCGNDGIQELAVLFLFWGEKFGDYNVISYEEDKLWLKQSVNNAMGEFTHLYYYGLEEYWCTGGYGYAHFDEISVLNEEITEINVYESGPYWGCEDGLFEIFAEDIKRDVYGDEYDFCNMFIVEYFIGDSSVPYHSYTTYGQELSEKDIEYIERLEASEFDFYTEEEIQELINQRKQELNLDDIVMSKIELDWVKLDSSLYN